ncbi:MAG: hypothetical protein AAB697_02235 [Patescibacteria group bacterium]
MKHFLILCSLFFLVLIPLFNPGFYTSPDGPSHLTKIAYFYQSLQSGNFFPGWVQGLNNNLGYPIFFFTYPLPYYAASLFKFLSLGTIDSLKLVMALVTLSGSLGMYMWIYQVFRKKNLALMSAVLYLFTPYRFLDFYVRAAFGEVVFLGLIPWLFWSMEKSYFKTTSIITATLILSHLQLSAIFLPISFLFKHSLRAQILGLGLAAFFWLPAILLLPLTKFSQTVQFIPFEHLATLKQVIYSPWGFGFSKPGPIDGMSFQLGIVNWLVLFASTITALIKKNKFFLVAVTICWLSIILVTSSPFGFWKLPQVQTIQFPWRLLTIPLIFMPLLAVSLFSLIKSKLPIIILIILAIYTNRNHIRTNLPQFENFKDADFLMTNTTATATPDEFMPIILNSNTRFVFEKHNSIFYGRLISLVSLGILSYGFIRRNYRQKQV